MKRGLTSSDFLFLSKIFVLAAFVSFHFMNVRYHNTINGKEKINIPVTVNPHKNLFLLAKNSAPLPNKH